MLSQVVVTVELYTCPDSVRPLVKRVVRAGSRTTMIDVVGKAEAEAEPEVSQVSSHTEATVAHVVTQARQLELGLYIH